MKINGVVHYYHLSVPEDVDETVLLIHGRGYWWMWWYRVIKELDIQGKRAVVYDLKNKQE